jgi:hypothetical protein
MAGPTGSGTGTTSGAPAAKSAAPKRAAAPARSRAATSKAASPAASPARAAAPAQASAPAIPAPVVAPVQPVVAPVVAPATVVAPPPVAPGSTQAPTDTGSGDRPGFRDNTQVLYGLIVVLAGFVAILFSLVVVLVSYKSASDATSATAILGVITTAIAGLGGAFFGVAVGQQGTANANRDRIAAEAGKDQAQMRTLKFAANMDPTVARRLLD